MDESNVHTSVVIELANQVDSEAQKMYQVDFNDVNSSKDYIIDQIFCGENVTVYALFEMEEQCSKSSDIEFGGTRTTSDLNDKTSGLNKSYKTEYLNEFKAPEENDDFPSKDISRKESFYCLQQYLDDSDPEEEHSGLRILYTKEAVQRSSKSEGRSPKPTGTRSRGVNTDIALCPKLLDDVQKVIAAGFAAGGKRDGDKEEGTDPPVISSTLSTTFTKANASSSTSSLNLVRKSSPNFLLVPLVMTEEGLLKQFGREGQNARESKGESQEKDETTISKNEVNSNVSPREENDEGVQRNGTCSTVNGHVCTCKPQPEGVEGDKVDETIFPRHSILEEIKSVQCKLTSIIHSLESNVSGLTKTELNRSREAVRECIRKISEEMICTGQAAGERLEPKTVEVLEKMVEEPKEEEKAGEVEKMLDLPLFTSVSHLPPSNGSQKKKRTSCSPDEVMTTTTTTTTVTREISATSSASTASTTSTYNTFSLRNILENSKENLKEDLEFFEASDPTRFCKKGKGTWPSKSDSNMRSKTSGDFKWPPQNSLLKKSQSLDLRHEKTDSFPGKKLKNVSYNLDNTVKGKGNGRSHPNNPGENSLGNGLPHNMGDEINIKEKVSKSANLDFDSVQMKKEEFFTNLKRDILEIETITEEVEGKNQPKNRLVLPQFLYKNDKVSVEYCDSNGNINGSVISGKDSIGSPDQLGVKSLRKTVENRRKMGGKEKTSSIYSRQRVNVLETSSKRDIPLARDVKRTTLRRTVDKPTVRTDRKEAFDQTKQKLLYRAVKSVVRANPDSKLHIDKLVKSAMENYTETKTGRQVQEEKVLEPKNEALSSRPPSQKRRRDVPMTSGNESRDKGAGQFFRKTSRASNLKMQQKSSLDRILQKEKTDQVLIFDKKLDNVFVAKKVSPETNGMEQPETGSRKPETAVEQPQSVVVELYSKKPATLDECTSGEVAESSVGSSLNRIPSYAKAEPVPKNNEGVNIMSDEDAEKAIVKSVWALTKVLLYGDGTKKFEILEASLTPPEYSLKSTNSYNENEETSKNR